MTDNLQLATRRGLALWLDLFISSAIPLLVYWVYFFFNQEKDPNEFTYAVTWVVAIVAYVYRVWAEAKNKTTLGRSVFQLEVVGESSIPSAALRNAFIPLMAIHNAVAFILLIVLAIFVIFDRAHIFDKLAKAVVTRTHREF